MLKLSTSLGCLLVVAAGCGGITRGEAQQAIESMIDRSVTIRYDIDSLETRRPFHLVRMDDGKRVLDYYDPMLSTPTWRFDAVASRLTVRYPAEVGQRIGVADVTMYVRGEEWDPKMEPKGVLAVAWHFLTLPIRGITGLDYASRFEHKEHYRLPLAVGDVGDLLEALLVEGYFDQALRADEGVTVNVKIDGVRDWKYWEPTPALDALIDRVRLLGEQIEYERAEDGPLEKLRGSGPQTRPDRSTGSR